MITDKLEKIAVIVVYYRDIPNLLSCFINKDKYITLMKDGVNKVNDHSCPRMTISLYDHNDNQKRLKDILDLLEDLKSNNQIVDYKHTIMVV